MSEQTKTPWRKNLDPRYICGEDLLGGLHGLRKEMVVTLVKYEDSPAYDQNKQKDVDKTALWLNDVETGKMIYKPVLLNVTNGKFLSSEIGGGSLFLEDFDCKKPFVMYACPDKRHGHVVRFKKYYGAKSTDDTNGATILNKCTTLEELKSAWSNLTEDERRLPTLISLKEKLKKQLK